MRRCVIFLTETSSSRRGDSVGRKMDPAASVSDNLKPRLHFSGEAWLYRGFLLADTLMIDLFLKKIFGSKNDRELKRLAPLVDRITTLEPEYRALSDAQLQAKTALFKERLDNGRAPG